MNRRIVFSALVMGFGAYLIIDNELNPMYGIAVAVIAAIPYLRHLEG